MSTYTLNPKGVIVNEVKFSDLTPKEAFKVPEAVRLTGDILIKATNPGPGHNGADDYNSYNLSTGDIWVIHPDSVVMRVDLEINEL